MVSFDFTESLERLRSLGFRPSKATTEQSIPAELSTCPELMAFFAACGGLYSQDAWIRCEELTPFGDQPVVRLLDLNRAASKFQDRDALPKGLIAIADGDDALIAVETSDGQLGAVFVIDINLQHKWPEDKMLAIPTLDIAVRDYYEAKKAGTLPAKPPEREHIYLAANSLSEFVRKLRVDET